MSKIVEIFFLLQLSCVKYFFQFWAASKILGSIKNFGQHQKFWAASKNSQKYVFHKVHETMTQLFSNRENLTVTLSKQKCPFYLLVKLENITLTFLDS